jgi:hypothetical protein
MTQRVPDGILVRLSCDTARSVRGMVWVASNGGQGVVQVRGEVIHARGSGDRYRRLLVVLISPGSHGARAGCDLRSKPVARHVLRAAHSRDPHDL